MDRPSSASQNMQRPLVDGDLLTADELVARPELPPRGVTAGRALAITFAGAFEFEVSRRATWIDPSRLLFIEAGQPYVDRHVVPGVGHSSVILRAGEGTLEELWMDVRSQLAARVGACSLHVQMLAQLLRRAADDLAGQELAIAILEESVADRRPITTVNQRCVRQAKALLHDCPEGRLSLSQIAAELGITPIHLTQSFKRSEGMPLYRYQTLLRLGRALDLLPDREDITDLALELGYSSHSHFTSVFKSEIGMTPSHYRAVARCRAIGHPQLPISLAS